MSFDARFRRRTRRAALLSARMLVALLFLLPLLWMVTTAFYRPGTPLPTSLRLLPPDPTTQNFARIWELVPLGSYTANSLLVAALGVPLTLLTASWAGLGMARQPRRSQRRWIVLSLAVLMVPAVALWSPRFFVYRSLGWYDTVWALVAPAWMGTSPFFVLIFYRAFRRVPEATYDAARLDGCGVLQLWWQVALPMARTSALAVALLSFIFYWGDFTSPLLYLNSESRYTLPVALQLLQQLARADWALLMAATVWVTFIPVALFLLAQPFFRGREQVPMTVPASEASKGEGRRGGDSRSGSG